MSHSSLSDKLGLVRYVVDPEPHIRVNKEICATCRDKVCFYVCPAECYTLMDEELVFSHQACLECGACRIACQAGAIDWSYPRGGFGVCFRLT